MRRAGRCPWICRNSGWKMPFAVEFHNKGNRTSSSPNFNFIVYILYIRVGLGIFQPEQGKRASSSPNIRAIFQPDTTAKGIFQPEFLRMQGHLPARRKCKGIKAAYSPDFCKGRGVFQPGVSAMATRHLAARLSGASFSPR